MSGVARSGCCGTVLSAIARMAAPILCFTAEDIWKHLPQSAREPGQRPPRDVPGEDSEPDARALETWTFLMTWRERVNATRWSRSAPRSANRSTRKSRSTRAAEQLPELRELRERARRDLSSCPRSMLVQGDIGVVVEVHPGPRCERCWKHYDCLAAEPNDVCDRCAAALAARKS